MAQLFETTITFTTHEESEQFFSGLGYTAIPVRGRRVLVSNNWDDFGNPIMTFARQHLGDVLTYSLSDVARKAVA
jgi:hypothetical protein